MNFFKTLFVTGSTAIVLMMATSVMAEKSKPIPPPDYDMKSYPATACQPSPAGIATYEYGRICNPANSTTDLTLNCPIVRDDLVEGDNTMIDVTVAQYVWPVECTAYSLGQYYEVIDELTNYTVYSGEQSIFLILAETEPDGYYSLSCTLPEDSCLFGYRVREWQYADYTTTTDYDR